MAIPAAIAAAMADHGVRLERDPQGGYVLLDGDEERVELPAIDEERAVWCAYYFLKGRYGERLSGPSGTTWPTRR